MSENSTVIVGNMTAPVELRFTPAGVALAKFTVASTPRVKDKATGNYVDGTPLFMDCVIWREMAEQAAESLDKGHRVVVVGRLKTESWEDKNGGGKRSKTVLEVDEIGASLRFSTVKITKAQRSGGNVQPSQASGGSDPWSSPAPSGGPTRTADFDQEPPF